MSFWPNSETTLCLSLSARPGNFGVRFHNYLFRKHGLNYLYLSRATQNISSAILALKEFNVRGCAISMPFKESAMEFMDSLDGSAESVGALNTIINEQGQLKGYNTDLWAIEQLIERSRLDKKSSVLVLGSGGIARAVLAAFQNRDFTNGAIMARNLDKAEFLAKKFGFKAKPWDTDFSRQDLIINATSIGFQQKNTELAPEFLTLCNHTSQVWDMVANPSPTALIQRAQNQGLLAIGGDVVAKFQGQKQFELYTNLTPSQSDIEEAFEFAFQSVTFTDVMAKKP